MIYFNENVYLAHENAYTMAAGEGCFSTLASLTKNSRWRATMTVHDLTPQSRYIQCKVCCKDLLPCDFYKSNMSKCKRCIKAIGAAYRRENAETIKAKERERYKSDPRIAERQRVARNLRISEMQKAGAIKTYRSRTLPDGGSRMCEVSGCKSAAYTGKFCSAHYHRQKRYGDPLAGGTFSHEITEWAEALVRNPQKECAIWPFGMTGVGYGAWAFKGERMGAHRALLIMKTGESPPDMEAAHGPCHNRACVNPDHLSWKTRAENIADKVRDGTAKRKSSKVRRT